MYHIVQILTMKLYCLCNLARILFMVEADEKIEWWWLLKKENGFYEHVIGPSLILLEINHISFRGRLRSAFIEQSNV